MVCSLFLENKIIVKTLILLLREGHMVKQTVGEITCVSIKSNILQMYIHAVIILFPLGLLFQLCCCNITVRMDYVGRVS